MAEERHRELHRFILNRASGSYRSAFYYNDDDWEALYVREDVPSERLRDELPDIAKRVRQNQPLLREEEYPPLGKLGATTEVHEAGVILHFPEGTEVGTIVSLDRDAARQLTGFVSQAISILQSPPSSDYHAATVDD